ncbi:MAG: A/G-specific adenine glycosylase, partial [Limisphaerales bacterium]
RQPSALKSTETNSSAIPSLLLDWFCANARDLPWRKTRDPYAIWVSEIMLQQTQVKTVIPYWERWMRELPDIASLATASSEKIHKLWEGLGYYTRVRNMQKAAQVILQQHGGTFPRTLQEVLMLPGIGRYTAGAICSIAYNQPTPILDGNVIRVLTRVNGISSNPKEKETNALLWNHAQTLVEHAARLTMSDRSAESIPQCSYLNQSLMELGAIICTPRQPHCEVCPIQKHCTALLENRVAELPNLGQRVVPTERHFVAFVVERRGKFLVQQRPLGVVNAHLWEFPNFETVRKRSGAPAHFAKISRKPLCKIKHSITRYRISLEAYRAELSSDHEPPGNWFTYSELKALAFPSAHRKILDSLQ